MMRNTEVPQMMTLVEVALLRAATSSERRGPIILTPDGEGDMDISRLRHRATIHVDVPSGSARPVIGPAIVFAKRLARRGLRWYLQPAFEQQTTFNHNVLDLFERARLENERLRRELEALRSPPEPAPDEPGPRP
jgi:hypothetical protein